MVWAGPGTVTCENLLHYTTVLSTVTVRLPGVPDTLVTDKFNHELAGMDVAAKDVD
jgi:FKBP-type peptidyl-prolyl cis-trans isomerase 2